jgi:uncharacterized protein
MIAQRRAGVSALCATCRACPVVRQCGGGLLAHRFRSGTGFDNPSVYCADLKELIIQVSDRPIHDSVDTRGTGPFAEPDGLPVGVLDDLGSGYGAAPVLETLHTTEMTMSRMLVAQVYEDATADTRADGELAETVRSAWNLVGHLDDTAPHELRRVLGHPYIRSWATAYLRRRPDTEPAPALGPGYLANVAAAAAIAANVSAEIPVPLYDGALHLPTIGTMLLGRRETGMALVVTRPGGFSVRAEKTTRSVGLDADEPATGWHPTRRLDCAGRSVVLDDTDPFRHGLGWPSADRMSPDEAGDLQGLLTAAWESVLGEVPRYATSLELAIHTVTPLAGAPSGGLRSGSSRDAYGAVGIGPVPDADALALLLVHEVQHIKFGALVDVYDLVDHDRPSFVRVGWRPDPRPTEAALTGAYAHLAVADIWRARIDRLPRPAPRARDNFRQYRDWVTAALAKIEATEALTEDGRRFVIAMRGTVESWGRDGQHLALIE